jgi:hypothetical protein
MGRRMGVAPLRHLGIIYNGKVQGPMSLGAGIHHPTYPVGWDQKRKYKRGTLAQGCQGSWLGGCGGRDMKSHLHSSRSHGPNQKKTGRFLG